MIKTKESPIFYTKNSQSIIILIFLFKKIKDNIYMILLLGTCYFCLLNHI